MLGLYLLFYVFKVQFDLLCLSFLDDSESGISGGLLDKYSLKVRLC